MGAPGPGIVRWRRVPTGRPTWRRACAGARASRALLGGRHRDGREAANPAGRFGVPAELGDACAYLCSAQAGFITGQNLLLDGGAYPGTV
jgi:3-oxoacyl-[acyl-carrier protein] reductase